MTYTEEKNKDCSLEHITITYCDRLVQITCDDALKNYLEAPGNGALQLSAHILAEYKKRRESELNISQDSLAIEILAHVYSDSFAEAVSAAGSRLPSVLSHTVHKLMKQVTVHTEIIDCGESSIDNNRRLWDALTPFKNIIYGILGDRA